MNTENWMAGPFATTDKQGLESCSMKIALTMTSYGPTTSPYGQLAKLKRVIKELAVNEVIIRLILLSTPICLPHPRLQSIHTRITQGDHKFPKPTPR
ncbi:conserved hypothetical protein [Ricinus communis]|uniref:Uncharacterized protein n=1 Tax=Ricinus communis TaxID=3988 RepID=B9RAA6_RICCO|nr:conserved hypothetical protein [Ricinus communis]